MPCAVHSTQPGGQARGDPGLDPEILFGSLHLVSFSLVSSASLLFLPSGVHYTISDDVTKLRSLVGFKNVDGFAFGCFTLKIRKCLRDRKLTQNSHKEMCPLVSWVGQRPAEICSTAAANVLSFSLFSQP